MLLWYYAAKQWDSPTTTPAAQLPEGMIIHSYNGCVGIQSTHLYQVNVIFQGFIRRPSSNGSDHKVVASYIFWII